MEKPYTLISVNAPNGMEFIFHPFEGNKIKEIFDQYPGSEIFEIELKVTELTNITSDFF